MEITMPYPIPFNSFQEEQPKNTTHEKIEAVHIGKTDII